MPDSDYELYRRVSIRVWGDEKFKAWSKDTWVVWFRFLTGPETTRVPGLLAASRVSLADKLRMSLDDFDRCVAEITDSGAAVVDWAADTVWLPKAIAHNALPRTINNAKGWARFIRSMDESPLRDEAVKHIVEYIKENGKPEHAAVLEGTITNISRNISRNISPNTSRNISPNYALGSALGSAKAKAPTTASKPLLACSLVDDSFPVFEEDPRKPGKSFEQALDESLTRLKPDDDKWDMERLNDFGIHLGWQPGGFLDAQRNVLRPYVPFTTTEVRFACMEAMAYAEHKSARGRFYGFKLELAAKQRGVQTPINYFVPPPVLDQMVESIEGLCRHTVDNELREHLVALDLPENFVFPFDDAVREANRNGMKGQWDDATVRLVLKKVMGETVETRSHA